MNEDIQSRVAKQMTEQWGIVASKELKSLCGKRHHQGKGEGLWKHLRWDPNLGTQSGEDPQRARIATVGVKDKQERAGPRARGTGARGCPRQGMCRGGRPASSPAGGNQSGRDKGMEELCLEHAEQGANRQPGAGPGACQRGQGWRWRSEFPIINGR